MTEANGQSGQEKKSGLAVGTLSMWEAFAQGLGTNGPAAVTALFFVSIAGLVGGSLPFVLILAFLIYAGMTLITYEWSTQVASAYSWAAFHKRGFKKVGGFFSYFGGLTYWYYYLLGYTGFAMLGLSSFLYVLFPSITAQYPWLWIPIITFFIVETTALAYFGIKISMRYILYTGMAEVIFLIITSIILIAIGGPKNTGVVFTAAPIGNNFTLIFVAMMLGIATFGGINSIVPVAEETKNPKRNVPIALVTLASIAGFVLILNAYSQTILFGINNMFNYAVLPDPGVTLYLKYLGLAGGVLLIVFVINSFNTSGVSFETSTIRTVYGYARDGVFFPKSFTKINKHKVPGNVVIFTGVLSLVIAIVAGLLMGPLTASIFLILSNSVFSFFNHALAGIELSVYHHRNKTLKVFRHVVIPWVTAIMIFIAIIYVVYPAPPAPLKYSAWVAGIYAVFVIISYFYYKSRSPEKLGKIGEFSL
ncbi:MAG: APC family permease [Candidatus Thermoplasmatota archaeon]|jgi:amino acid transporter|nr:APC family permease [Candidatus Thermoplasmatota archaeon]MCL5789006.1 APC family permease [Candidatus Thermoplasmatota archaeon]